MKGIHKVYQYMFTCDLCGDIGERIVGDDIIFDLNSAIKNMRQFGWKIGKRIICNKCKLALTQNKTNSAGEENDN